MLPVLCVNLGELLLQELQPLHRLLVRLLLRVEPVLQCKPLLLTLVPLGPLVAKLQQDYARMSAPPLTTRLSSEVAGGECR